MEKRISFYDIEDLIERMDDENLTFDYPIQRADGQWDKSQKALLIDSVLKGYINIAESEPDRVRIIDACDQAEVIAREIAEIADSVIYGRLGGL